MITVIGININPAPALAMAPVVRFARFESLGRAEEWLGRLLLVAPRERRRFECATFCRKAFSVVKYIADPNPVRRAEGSVPRQKEKMEFEDFEISRIEASSELCPDCCTRVLRRSAGWRSTAESTPDPRPAMKWKASKVSKL